MLTEVNRRNSAMPVTSIGNTSGESTSPWIRPRPGNE